MPQERKIWFHCLIHLMVQNFVGIFMFIVIPGSLMITLQLRYIYEFILLHKLNVAMKIQCNAREKIICVR